MSGEKVLDRVTNRQWEVEELIQSENTDDWIASPDKISKIQYNLNDLKQELSNLKPPLRILDVGCYTGYLYDYLLKYVFKNPLEFHYTGIDVNAEAIAHAKKRHIENENSEFLVGDIYDLQNKFGSNTFDVVCCYRVLIHIPFFKDAIQNMYNVASQLVHTVLRVSDKDICTRCCEFQCETNKAAIYYVRTFSFPYLFKTFKEFGIEKFKLIRRNEAYCTYSTLSFSGRKENKK